MNQVIRFKVFAISIAGFIREKKDADIMIPADRANIIFIMFLFSFFIKKIMAEPSTVTKKVKHPARKD